MKNIFAKFYFLCYHKFIHGRMSEWSNVLVSKTGIPQGIMGSNPIPSANSKKSLKALQIKTFSVFYKPD